MPCTPVSRAGSLSGVRVARYSTNRGISMGVQRHHALAGALGVTYPQQAPVEIDVIPIEPQELWAAQAGNHRVSFVALSAALWSFGLPNVSFIGAEEMIAHDDALVPALSSAAGEVASVAQLLARRIESAGSDPA